VFNGCFKAGNAADDLAATFFWLFVPAQDALNVGALQTLP
jgi:hypothetical protein